MGEFGTGHFGFRFFRVQADSGSGPFGFEFFRVGVQSGSGSFRLGSIQVWAHSGSGLSIVYIIFLFYVKCNHFYVILNSKLGTNLAPSGPKKILVRFYGSIHGSKNF